MTPDETLNAIVAIYVVGILLAFSLGRIFERHRERQDRSFRFAADVSSERRQFTSPLCHSKILPRR